MGESLFAWERDESGAINYEAPHLAKSYTLAPDLSKVTVNLQQGVQFQQGWGELTAEDVAWTYDTANPAINPLSVCNSCGNLTSLLGANPVKVLDKYTVEFTFDNFDVRWASAFMNLSGHVGLQMFSKKVFDERGRDWMNDNIILTGPFQTETWVQHDRAVATRAFDNHWKWGKVEVERFIIQVMPEESIRAAALLTGELDASELSQKSAGPLVARGFKVGVQGAATQMGVFFAGNNWETTHALTGEAIDHGASGVYARDIPWIGNPFKPDDGDNPPGVDDMEQARLLRYALAIAIDREAINTHIVQGFGWPVHVEFVDITAPEWDSKWEYPYDPAKAEELLDKAGYQRDASGVRLEVPLYAGPEAGGPAGTSGEISDAISGYWEKIGVKTPILKYQYMVLRPGLVSRTVTLPWLCGCDEGMSLFPWDWPKGMVTSTLTRPGYGCGFENPEVTRLYKETAKEVDRAKRIELVNEYVDYLYYWALQPGVVAVPMMTVYNPRHIKEWNMGPTQQMAFTTPWTIKLAD